MGPQSKEAVCEALGYLIEALTQTNALLERLEKKLAPIEARLRRSEEAERADLAQVNKRVTELEKALRRGGGTPTPAE